MMYPQHKKVETKFHREEKHVINKTLSVPELEMLDENIC